MSAETPFWRVPGDSTPYLIPLGPGRKLLEQPEVLTADQLLNMEAARLAVAFFQNRTRMEGGLHAITAVSDPPSDAELREKFKFFKNLLKFGE